LARIEVGPTFGQETVLQNGGYCEDVGYVS
jgi:hypothetical protein